MQHSALEFLPVGKLASNPLRFRQTIPQRALLELADSMRKFGVISPLLVNKQGNAYKVICGERRLRAAKLAGLDEVPCLIVSADAKEVGLYVLAENLQRQSLNLIDQAYLIQKLHASHNLSFVEIGSYCGIDVETLQTQMKVLDLPERMRSSYVAGELSNSAVMELLGIEDSIIQDTRYKALLDS